MKLGQNWVLNHVGMTVVIAMPYYDTSSTGCRGQRRPATLLPTSQAKGLDVLSDPAGRARHKHHQTGEHIISKMANAKSCQLECFHAAWPGIF